MSITDLVQLAQIVSGISAVGLLGLALIKLPEFQAELNARFLQEKKWETVKACQKFTTDPAILNLFTAINSANIGTDAHRDYTKLSEDPGARMAARILLNYFDTLAIGIQQSFYIEQIIADHFKPTILRMVCDAFLYWKDGSIGSFSWKAGTSVATVDVFPDLAKLYNSWYPGAHPAKYKGT